MTTLHWTCVDSGQWVTTGGDGSYWYDVSREDDGRWVLYLGSLPDGPEACRWQQLSTHATLHDAKRAALQRLYTAD